MRILIAYASNNNTTEICAKMLAEKLSGAETVNLTNARPDISDFDTIVIGSCIRFNMVHRAVLDFVKDNIDILMKANTAIYLCCGFPEKSNQYLLHNFPKKLLNKCISIQCFGGRLKVKPYKVMDQLIIKTVKKNFKADSRELEIDTDSINKMVDDILKLQA